MHILEEFLLQEYNSPSICVVFTVIVQKTCILAKNTMVQAQHAMI